MLPTLAFVISIPLFAFQFKSTIEHLEKEPGHQLSAINPVDYSSCGVTSLYTLALMRGLEPEWSDVKKWVGPPGPDGTNSFSDISNAANKIGLESVGVRATYDQLLNLPFPAIVQLRKSTFPESQFHLSVLLNATPEYVWLLDPPVQPTAVTADSFKNAWTGNVLVFPDGSTKENLYEYLGRKHYATWRNIVFVLIGLCSVACLAFATRNHIEHFTPLFASARKSHLRLSLVRPVSLLWFGLIILVCGTAGYFFIPIAPVAHSLFENSVIDLGQVPIGANTFDLVVRNTGSKEISITKAVSSCSCAVVEFPKTIPAGGASKVQVKVSVGPGRREAKIQLYVKDFPVESEQLLRWEGLAPALLSPPRIASKEGSLGKPYERFVNIVFPSGSGTHIPRLESVDCDSELVQIHELGNDPQSRKLVYASDATVVRGNVHLRVVVRSPDDSSEIRTIAKLHIAIGKEKVALQLPISIFFKGDQFNANTKGLTFYGLKDERGKPQQRSVVFTGEKAKNGIKIVSCPEWLLVDENRIEKQTSRLSLQLKREVASRIISGEIIVSSVEDPSAVVSLSVLFVPAAEPTD